METTTNSIKLNYKTSKEFNEAYEQQISTLRDINALEKFKIVFELYEYLNKNLDIKKWGIIFIKTEYREYRENEDAGIYVDIATDLTQNIKTPNWKLDGNYKTIRTPRHTHINNILNKYNDINSFQCKVYENNEYGMHNMIQDFIGKTYLARYHKEILETSILDNMTIKQINKL